MLHGLCFGEEAGARNLVFPCTVAAADDERYLVCAAGAAAVVLPFFSCRTVTVASSCFGCACVCVRSFRAFWNLRLQIALEWLHDCCHLVLLCV